MIEPNFPVTIWVKSTPYPAFLLDNDEGAPVRPSSIILRHRHLRHQQRIIDKGVVPKDGPGARPMRGVLVSSPGTTVHDFHLNPESSTTPSTATTGTSSSHSADSPNLPLSAAASPLLPASTDQPPPLDATSSLDPSLPLDPTSHGSPSSHSDPVPALPPAVPAIPDVGPSGSNNSHKQIIRTSIGVLEIRHTARKLRSRKKDEQKLHGEKTAWFYSRDDRLLDVPPGIPIARPGELYVHHSKHERKQIWLLDESSAWQSVQLLHPHPYLEEYFLNLCNNGEPSWVTRDTIRTYKGRILKTMRDAAKLENGLL
ncbi:hypothetical protein OH76DRAFT_1481326 [Lentinus brumalis]|uniref:Uncharacterized protein n=1 Tax=Lentinus brumalis TaxID=2498619 RepID=A0A371DGY9_9APHY|nr:hypothetical protein OH76DRAFT_1481326 [Polyporus brumalis]